MVVFAISGFVIPCSLKPTAPRPLLSFVVSRTFRIYPAYWVSIAAAILVAAEPLSQRQILVNITMLQTFLRVPDVLGVYWTLAIELVFYGTCVFLFCAKALDKPIWLFRCGLFFLLCSIGLAAVRYRLGVNAPVALPLGLTTMFFGALWRAWLVGGDPQARRLGVGLLATFVLAMPMIAVLAYNRDYGHNETWYRYVLSYYSAFTIFVLFTAVWRPRNKVLSWLGRISYSIYLVHLVVLALSPIILKSWIAPLHLPLGGHVCAALYLAGVVGASAMVYYAVEAPAIAMGRRLISGMRRGAIASAAVAP